VVSGWCSLCDAAQALMCRLALVWCSAVTCRCSKSHTLHFRHFVRADQDVQAQAVFDSLERRMFVTRHASRALHP
jgi:hypothetical protein